MKQELVCPLIDSNGKIDACADLYLDSYAEGEFIVWALDPTGDGGIINTIFSGVFAEKRARDYASQTFSEVNIHAPRQ